MPRIPPEKRTGLARFFTPPETTLPASTVDREVEDGEVLPEVLGGLQVVATPGHAPGHIAFWQPEKRILFCGDVLFHLLRLGLPPSFFTFDMDENKRSIQRIAQLDPAIICFGHGPPIKTNAAQRLRRFAEKVVG